MTKTAIITGVTGQDGSYLAKFLLDKGYRVVGLKRRTSLINTGRIDDIFSHENFHLEYFDLNDAHKIYSLLLKYNPDEFYNIAAQSHVKVSFDISEHTVDGIVMGTLRILNAIKEVCPKCRFYQASSSEMYGDNSNPPVRGFNEASKFMPASPYACAKVCAHQLVRNYRESYGLYACAGILFNHESPLRGETFVTRKITLAAARIKLKLQDKLFLGNLDARRDWGYAGDYVEAMWMMLQRDKPKDFVIATGKSYTVRDFLYCVFRHAGLNPDKHVEIDKKLFRPHEVPWLKGDATGALKTLGWKPRVSFEELALMMYSHDLETVQWN